MELRHLRYFAAVAEEGSFYQAAQRLLVSQPSLSRQIMDLERRLGQRLFDRTSRGVRLTPSGEALLQHARQILGLAATTQEVVSEAARARQVVSVGVPPATPASWLSSVVEAVAAALPHAELNYVEATSFDQLRLLHEGRLDLCLVHRQPPGHFASWLVRQETLGLAVRPGHPLADEPGYRVGDLHTLRVLVHAREREPAQASVTAAVLAAGVRPYWQFAQFTEHVLACAQATRSDAALVASHVAALRLPGWRWRPVQELPQAVMTTWLVCQRPTRAVVDEVAGVMRAVPA
ncbi:LysR family transcriptional regulator [Nonomuraea sp. MG754425]|uniref:LysR family transcriptional regulator n=1 Tax=Nonomuraea sp. MG754425 TaxID=2570319 RepID=UPI001F21FF88|nr:LysR family transcriptional regulator [Nonomuraea sp. MG754425]MCF6469431.1 LysR family transcriptional regulator [Nonomuraea sp. MG754425]